MRRSRKKYFKAYDAKRYGTAAYNLVHKAQQAVARAVKKGLLATRPFRCGSESVIAHHFLGYAGKNALRVAWRCRSCHYKSHH